MSKKLKTLKDLDLDEYPDHRTKSILKQEAIKWVKKLREERKILYDLSTVTDNEGKQAVMIAFFDITEEDLK